MPFVKISPTFTRSTTNRDRVAMSVVVNKRTNQVYLQFGVGANVCKAAGWERIDRIDVSEGTGEDAGKVMLQRSPTGYKIGAAHDSHARVLRLIVGKLQHYHVDSAPRGQTRCEFSIDGAGILIEAPEWLRCNILP
jgi:hypothetical protein